MLELKRNVIFQKEPMSELGEVVSRNQAQEILNHWGPESVSLKAIRERKLNGSGLKITIIDPNAGKKSITIFGGNQNVPEVHGYGIAGFIKTVLPGATVELVGVVAGETLDQEIKAAIKRGADVISMSMGTPKEPVARETKAAFHEVVGAAVWGNKEVSFPQAMAKYRGLQTKTMKVRAMEPFLKRIMVEAEKRGTIVVAASGYSCDTSQDTFSRFPSVIMVGGFDHTFQPIKGPENGRIDIYAPGTMLAPVREHAIERMTTSHSMAAPYVAIACAVARQFLGKNPEKIREAVFRSTRSVNNMKVIDFNYLMKWLEGQGLAKAVN